MITIIDYGMGNLASIKNMLKKVGEQSVITNDLDKISNAEKLILPGVGSFGQGMENLNAKGMTELIRRKALVEKTPLLGICLGMQLFTKHSEEGNVDGLGLIDAKTVKFNLHESHGNLKIPHMGWADVEINSSNFIFEGIEEIPRYYFVHSYHVECANEEDIMTTTEHGYSFCSGVRKENVFGVQFHPEKSHKFGMALLKNFIKI